jgi:hypothetical protein
MDEFRKIVDDLIDNHYRRQHLIGTEEEESEYLQDLKEVDDE